MERAMYAWILCTGVLGIVTVALGAPGAAPVPCCAPKQFTTHYEQVIVIQSGDLPMSIAEERLDAAYDFIDALVGFEISSHPVNQTEIKLKVIQNFTSGYQWIIQGSNCMKQALTAQSVPMRCIPAGATFQGTFAIGLEKLQVHTWLIDSSAPNVGQQRYTVTDYMCTPFSSTFVGTASSVQPPATFVTSGNYMNFTSSIADPDRWFKLPSICNNATGLPFTKNVFSFPSTPQTRFF